MALPAGPRSLVRRLMAASLAGSMAACSTPPPAPVAPARKDDFLKSNIDVSINPGDDFFEYANGAWLKAHPIPDSEPAWGIGNVVQDELYKNLRAINEAAVTRGTEVFSTDRAPLGTEVGDQQKIGDFWSEAMDEAKIDRNGLAPLKAELDRIDAITTVQGVIDAAFAMRPLGVGAFFDVDIAQDEKKSDEMAVHVTQGGLGLPDRDYYFNAEAGVAKTRAEYVAHIARMLTLIHQTDGASTAAAAVMTFETTLAAASRKLEDLRDPEKNYNKMAPAALTSGHTPSIAWQSRLASFDLKPAAVIVGQPEFFSALDKALQTTPVAVLQDYLRYHLVSTYASFLSKPIDDENFSFYRGVLLGQKEQRPRWKRALDAEEAAMGMVLGRIFVKAYFPEAAKRRYSESVEAIRSTYAERIAGLDWMSDATKARAQAKLAAMTKKVGYPDTWKDYSALVIGRDSYCRNMMNAARWKFDDARGKFGKPVDRTEWDMSPQTYNAYYNPSNNEIVLPAAIFTIPGVTDAEVDDAVVYGYAGASTIGHEMTHGFDDEGRQFDVHGNLTDWWTKADAAAFQKRADVMVRQFDAYEPLSGLHINGKASLGENIADYGGVLLGLEAFKKTEQYKKGESIGGFTPVQRYFLGYALGWQFHQREARLRQSLLSDVHSPAKWRVLGPLANVPEFYEAFGVKPGQPMYRTPETHVRIW